MRLWHEALLPYLPRAQLLGQHRECCALRGLAWGRRHAVVDYVFTHSRERLAVYHARVMREMERRGYHHRSPLDEAECRAAARRYEGTHARVDAEANARELKRRCPDCARRLLSS